VKLQEQKTITQYYINWQNLIHVEEVVDKSIAVELDGSNMIDFMRIMQVLKVQDFWKILFLKKKSKITRVC